MNSPCRPEPFRNLCQHFRQARAAATNASASTSKDQAPRSHGGRRQRSSHRRCARSPSTGRTAYSSIRERQSADRAETRCPPIGQIQATSQLGRNCATPGQASRESHGRRSGERRRTVTKPGRAGASVARPHVCAVSPVYEAAFASVTEAQMRAGAPCEMYPGLRLEVRRGCSLARKCARIHMRAHLERATSHPIFSQGSPSFIVPLQPVTHHLPTVAGTVLNVYRWDGEYVPAGLFLEYVLGPVRWKCPCQPGAVSGHAWMRTWPPLGVDKNMHVSPAHPDAVNGDAGDAL
jgi:hypothetical protein